MATWRQSPFAESVPLGRVHLVCSPTSRNTPPLRGLPRRPSPRGRVWVQDSYLVDSASSHMLVSKIKPCMSKYKQLYRETANGSLNQLSFI